MELKLPKKELKIDLYGEKEEVLRFATTEECENFSKEVVKADASEFTITRGFLIDLGMSAESAKKLTPDDMLEITYIVTGQKKI